MPDDGLYKLFSDTLNVPLDSVTDETSPDNTPSWNSLKAMELVALIEDTFDVTLSTREIMKMRTVGIVREVLREKGVAGV